MSVSVNSIHSTLLFCPSQAGMMTATATRRLPDLPLSLNPTFFDSFKWKNWNGWWWRWRRKKGLTIQRNREVVAKLIPFDLVVNMCIWRLLCFCWSGLMFEDTFYVTFTKIRHISLPSSFILSFYHNQHQNKNSNTETVTDLFKWRGDWWFGCNLTRDGKKNILEDDMKRRERKHSSSSSEQQTEKKI